MSKETDELNARIARLEAMAGLKRSPIRKPGKRAEKQTVEGRARAKLREYLDPAELVEFEKSASELDALEAALHATKDPAKAHDLAYRLVADTSALFALEIPLLEKIQAEVAVVWQELADQMAAARVLKKEAQQANEDVRAEQPKLPNPNPSQSKKERMKQIEPLVHAYTEKRRKARETMLETLKEINETHKGAKAKIKELHTEHSRLESIIKGLKGLPDIRFPLPHPRTAALHDPSKPVFHPDMSPSEKMHASGEHYAERFVEAMDDAKKA